MSVAYTLGTVFRLKRSQRCVARFYFVSYNQLSVRAFAMAAAMFMNSNSLPIALMQSLVGTVHALKWDKDDNKNAMLGRALTYLVLYSTLGMVLRWSYGVRLLAQADDEVTPPTPSDETTPLLSDRPQTYGGDTTETDTPTITVQPPPISPRPLVRRRTTFYASFPNTPNRSRMNLPSIESEAPSARDSTVNLPPQSTSDTDSDVEEDRFGQPGSAILPTSGRPVTSAPEESSVKQFLRRSRRRAKRVWAEFNDFMTVPLWAALLSIIVACIPPLQHTLDVHMQPVKGAINRAGSCSIPVTLLVLGAYMYKFPDENTPAIPTRHRSVVDHSKSHASLIDSVRDMFNMKQSTPEVKVKHPGETKTVAIAVLSRMIITPVLVMPIVAFGAKFDIHAILEEYVCCTSLCC